MALLAVKCAFETAIVVYLNYCPGKPSCSSGFYFGFVESPSNGKSVPRNSSRRQR